MLHRSVKVKASASEKCMIVSIRGSRKAEVVRVRVPDPPAAALRNTQHDGLEEDWRATAMQGASQAEFLKK
eukprot:scaffold312702_cov35-Prasinocladus_malaysianus.AAC.1